ncbi:MAG: gamma-glutamyl-gamma-aminobutyrate hydrolase family protein [Rhodocyclaceae bacterium]|nr:gamma-glutamyl-gamma-aminobutyrate hydrolase family protein [Rhodocyclaceae bacterium]MBL0076708.1 gamma-glutamyl-gamma-aminobutyrate hydrolase family protein [Rhodocyclaceae bacterium]MBP6109768.1 gamma-glutamyl-gamma-aminobutyrate hydrolase family protein [Rhodocyclaceae bacterium]MBP6278228.1 gamma-glutamyl-gamma-aminobutyrate hydrolase family protein [Rhodocyclaceae bacterium]
MPFNSPTMLIGVSARIYYPSGPVLDLGGVWTKTLHYLEQSVAQWVMRGGALPVMIPAVDAQSVVQRDDLNLRHYADALDGLVLQGGNDVAPQTYGESPLSPAWSGDSVRDLYEIALIHAFLEAGKPVFGICRGLQMLNVTFGGTLWQDIKTQCPGAVEHVKEDLYERNLHRVEIIQGTHLAELYPDLRNGMINSIHHQGIQKLAPGFVVEAQCPDDGMIEAIRRTGPGFVAGVQWHPEFRQKNCNATFDDNPVLQDFLRFARSQKRLIP